MIFLGKHLIVDMWGVENLDNQEFIQEAFSHAAKISNATLLKSEFHDFGEGYGITGVSLLAESHMSVHTWPEHKYAAVDIYMCGETDPYEALDALKDRFSPTHLNITEHKRGALCLSQHTASPFKLEEVTDKATM
jgi:S-adenosylmethionine decarboxylase